jgi:hypothetical protein
LSRGVVIRSQVNITFPWKLALRTGVLRTVPCAVFIHSRPQKMNTNVEQKMNTNIERRTEDEYEHRTSNVERRTEEGERNRQDDSPFSL